MTETGSQRGVSWVKESLALFLTQPHVWMLCSLAYIVIFMVLPSLPMLGLLALAITSNRYSMRKLGASWKKLHRLIYVILGLGLLHMLWVVRSDLERWAVYAIVGLVLMLLRTPPIARQLPRLRSRPTAG